MSATLNTEESMDITENQSHDTKQLVQPGCINTVIKTELESYSGFTLGSPPGSRHTECANDTRDIKPDIKTEPIEHNGYLECNTDGTTDIGVPITSAPIRTESIGLIDKKGAATCNRYDTVGLIDSKDDIAGLTVENITPDIHNQNPVNGTQNGTPCVNSQLTDKTCAGPITSGGTNTSTLIGSNSARTNKQNDTLNVDTELNRNGSTAAITTKDTSDFVDKESNSTTNGDDKPITQNQSDEFKRTMRAFHGTNAVKENEMADNNSYSGKSKESTVVSDTDSKHETSENDSSYESIDSESFSIVLERKKEGKCIWENGQMRYIEREYICDICGMRFFTHRTLENHIIRHYDTPNQKGFKCRHCPRILTAQFSRKQHERLHTNEKPYKCKICKMHFVRKDMLRSHHLKEHSTGTQFLCDICGTSFARQDYLNQHYTVHTGERKYECKFCDKTFRKSSDRSEHMLIAHQKLKCTECELILNGKRALKKHSMLHKSKKAFQCDQCEASFAKNGLLIRHKLIHSALKPFNCDYCTFATAHRISIRRHTKTLHNIVL